MISRGFMDDEEAFLAEAREKVTELIRSMTPDTAADRTAARQDIRSALGKFVNSRTRRRPVIIPIVMDI